MSLHQTFTYFLLTVICKDNRQLFPFTPDLPQLSQLIQVFPIPRTLFNLVPIKGLNLSLDLMVLCFKLNTGAFLSVPLVCPALLNL